MEIDVTVELTAERLPSGDLKISTDEDGQKYLQALRKVTGDDFGTDETLESLFERLIENSEYQWTKPEYCGALTSAPMLGVYGKEVPLHEGADPTYHRIVGHWDDRTWYAPLEKAWAFMNYALRAPQDDLADYGYCIFQGGPGT